MTPRIRTTLLRPANFRLALTVMFLLASAVAWGQGALEIIPLRHRSVEQVIPVLRPLLERDGVLSGQGYQLIVRASPANLAEIKAALAVIDIQARRLLVHVRFGQTGEEAHQQAGVAGSIGSEGARISARAGASMATSSEHIDQTIQVLEGGRALIAAGQTRPVQQRQVTRAPGGYIVSETSTLQTIATGFEVVPRLVGTGTGRGEVQLEVSPQRETPGTIPGSVQGQRMVTTVRARLGEWVEIGGTAEQRAAGQRGIASYAGSNAQATRSIWVKVEEVPF